MTALAYAALWLFVFTIPWENAVTIIPGTSLLTKVTGALALAGAFAVVITSGRVRRWHPAHVGMLLFLVWTGGELFFWQSGTRLPYKYTTFLMLFAMVFIIWEVAQTHARQRGLLGAYVFGSYIAGLSTVAMFRTQAGALKRFSGVEADPNSLAMTLALALPMAWYLGMTTRSTLFRWVYRGFVAVGIVAIALTASRGGMLAAFTALMIVPVTMTKLTPGRMAAAIGLLALSGALAVAYVPDKIIERLSTTSTEVEDLSLGGRFGIWKAGVRAFATRPFTGYGIGNWRTAVSPWLGPDPQVAHNSFLSVLVESGLIGLAIYRSVFAAVFLALQRLPSMERRFAFVLFCTLIVTMSPLSWHDQKSVWFVLAVILGMARATGPALWDAVRQAVPVRAVPMQPAMVARSRMPLMRGARTPDRDPTL
jgi:O-antigen ligase